MKLTSDSFVHDERIPERCAFGIPHPQEHMALGENRNPQLSWSDLPEGTRSLVLMCIDSDVPSSAEDVNQEGKTISASLPRVDFTHWVIVDLPAAAGSLAEGECSSEVTLGGKTDPAGPEGTRQGVNDYTNFLAGDATMGGVYLGYDGPCPPWNDEILHHYHFQLYAIDLERCPVDVGFTAADVLAAIDGHILASATLTGSYCLNPAVS